MVIITGDTHGDYTRFGFYRELFAEMTKEDYVIVCGDFGGVWSGSQQEHAELEELSSYPFTLLFVSGNHENYDLLAQYPVTEWHGGKVQFITDSVIHLMRGQVYTLCGKTFFTFGGASSHDIEDGILEPDEPDFSEKRKRLDAKNAMYRINHRSWWKQELPSQAELDEGIRNLDECKLEVDYVITHCAPTTIQYAFSPGMFEADILTDYLEGIKNKCSFKHWYFGHYHKDRMIQNNFTAMYWQLICIFDT